MKITETMPREKSLETALTLVRHPGPQTIILFAATILVYFLNLRVRLGGYGSKRMIKSILSQCCDRVFPLPKISNDISDPFDENYVRWVDLHQDISIKRLHYESSISSRIHWSGETFGPVTMDVFFLNSP